MRALQQVPPSPPRASRTPRTPRTHARRVRRGAAMLEAVIALPVFLLVLVGLGYVHRLYVAQQGVYAATRASVWPVAVAGCAEDPLAGNTLPIAPDGVPGSAVADATTSVQVREGSVFKSLEDVPVVGELLSVVLPIALTHEQTRSVRQPLLLHARAAAADGATPGVRADEHGSPMAVLRGATTSICNEQPVNPLAKAKEVFIDLLCKVDAAGLCGEIR